MKRNPFQFPIIVLRTISLDRWGLNQSLLLSSLILLLVGKGMLRRSGLLMASILLLVVFLLLTTGIFLGGLWVWTISKAYSFWQERYRWCPCWECKDRCDWWFSLGFLVVGILGILWGSTTLLLLGDAVSVASKFLSYFYSYWLFLLIFPTRFVDEPFFGTESYQFR